jgi:DNA primase
MEIKDIKSQLSLAQVLQYYNLTPDKNNHLHCPWHEDKKASLQVNLEKNFYKCHGCGKHGDQIQWIEDFEKLTKAEAINKSVSMINKAVQLVMNYELGVMSEKENTKEIKPYEYREIPTENLEEFFAQLKKNIVYSQNAQNYLQQRKLDHKLLEIGYNGKTYKNLRNCVVFPLKNKENQIVSFYGRSVFDIATSKHFYLKNRQGLYPNYPNPNTKKLILTESIIDAASLLPLLKEAPFGGWGIIACYGTNGLNDEILNSIKSLEKLEEIIFAFDNDEAGKEAIKKYGNLLLAEVPRIKISALEPINKDINETLQAHEESIFLELLDKRTDFIFSTEKPTKQETQNLKLNTQNLTTDFLKQKDLLKNLNHEIGKAGIVGEENSRMLLFLIILSYLNKNPLHALVQGSSGSGKTHIISRIADLMPQEDVLRFTRITESSLYNWGEYDLFRKIIIIEDLDGLKEDALYALREFISNQVLRSSVSVKDKKGNNKSAHKIVKGQFSSLSATTKGETYQDNMNRSFIIAMNESDLQTQKIINHQNERIAGIINDKDEKQTILFIQQMIRNLQQYEVVNPFAMKLQLPNNVKNKRRLNEMFQSIIKQITFLNQYQRRLAPSPSGRAGVGILITEIEDIENAVTILFESIILKIDELDGSLRQFLEALKKPFAERDFTRFEAMEVTGYKKSQLQVYLNELVRYGYLRQSGHPNKGFKYKMGYNDDIQKVRDELKTHFTHILHQLKTEANGSKTETKQTNNQINKA